MVPGQGVWSQAPWACWAQGSAGEGQEVQRGSFGSCLDLLGLSWGSQGQELGSNVISARLVSNPARTGQALLKRTLHARSPGVNEPPAP